ncbi:MAG: MlaC/ttg2D family ABC transporter substrate-binding protein [Gammaproteobacteria bacterium]
MIKNRWYYSALLLIAVSIGAVAEEFADPQRLVDTTIESLRMHVNTESHRIERDPKYTTTLISRHLSPHIDLELTSRLVLGEVWLNATPDQQQAFVTTLRQLLLRIFATHILDYRDAAVSYAPTKFSGQKNQIAVVRSTVSRSGIPPIRVDYRFYKASDVWKVYDVAIVGVSLVKTFRITAKYELKKHSLDEIIEKMKAMTPLERTK